MNPESLKNTWRSYLLCRKDLLFGSSIVSPGVWSVLWAIFARRDALNLHRMPRIKTLGEDMVQAGMPMNDLQRLLYIEATFMQSTFTRDLAIQQWLDTRADMLRAPSKPVFKDYWSLGVKMFCEVGNPDVALQVAENLLGHTEDAEDFRILLPIIQTCLESPHHKVKMAWESYVRLKLNLGDHMTMEDYDAVTVLFLNANEPNLALGAFKDMMLTGNASIAQEEPRAPHGSAADTEGELIPAKNDEKEVNWHNSQTLTRLPHKFNNKYFFGSWIKKLIGEKQLDAAKKVLDLMDERAICPDSKHVNGLIGAWIREGSTSSRELAEDLAWKMIKARLEFVKRRDVKHNLKWPLQPTKTKDKSSMKPISLTPNATIETFSILIQYYRRAQKEELLVELFNMLKSCKIRPDTFFLNQLILIDSRSPKMPWAWDMYVFYVTHHGIRPDFDTYSYLWQLMVKAVDTNTYRYDHFLKRRFTTPRKLFAEMASRARLLAEHENMPRELYESIILSFGLGGDHVGTAVALHSLHRDFDMLPSEDTVRSIVLALARGDQKNLGGRVDLNDTSQEKIGQVTRILQTLKNQRVGDLLEQGIVFEELTQDKKLEESMDLLSKLLRSAATAQMKAEGHDATELSRIAAQEMGVSDCVPWPDHDGELEN
jgi:pentatricopeptide repeat protein